MPPIGAPFLAWEDEAAIAGWLDRAPPAVSDAFLTDQHRNLALIRERGFQVALRSPGSPRLAPEFGEGAGYAAGYKDRMLGMAGALREIPLPETIEPDTLYDVILIAAPVFDAEGRCAFSLCLGDFTGRLDGGTILAHAERLVAACLAVMQADRG